jgi:hypothetical protein
MMLWSPLASLQFEPYCLLWETADSWLRWKSRWMNDPFISLDSAVIERDHELSTKNINKSVRYFEKMGVTACLGIATQIKQEVRTVLLSCFHAPLFAPTLTIPASHYSAATSATNCVLPCRCDHAD